MHRNGIRLTIWLALCLFLGAEQGWTRQDSGADGKGTADAQTKKAPAPGKGNDKILQRLNDMREAVGLAKVEEDKTLSEGCQQHANYLATNFGRPEARDGGAHREEAFSRERVRTKLDSCPFEGQRRPGAQ